MKYCSGHVSVPALLLAISISSEGAGWAEEVFDGHPLHAQ